MKYDFYFEILNDVEKFDDIGRIGHFSTVCVVLGVAWRRG